jgi:hypothetical protein
MKENSIEEKKRASTYEAELLLKKSVADYCTIRNAQAQRIDRLKEYRLNIDNTLAAMKLDLDSLSGRSTILVAYMDKYFRNN